MPPLDDIVPEDRPPEFWQRLQKTERNGGMPLRDAMEFFTVKTDTKEDDTDAPEFVKFVLRALQLAILLLIEAQWAAGVSARIMNLKSRRYGMTTFYRVLFFLLCIRLPGWEGMLVAQDDPTSKYLFSLIRDELLPQIPEEHRVFEVIKSDAKELVFKNIENGRVSRFRVATAKTDAIGRARFNNGIVLTEFPHYPSRVKQDLSSILPTCKHVRGNLVVFESTAKGYEEFYRRYTRAEEGKGKYLPFFIPSWAHPQAHEEFRNEDEALEFADTVGLTPEVGQDEERMLVGTLEAEGWEVPRILTHLNWRRTTFYDECEANLKVHKREYPNTPAEAFQGTGRPVFEPVYVTSWLPFAEKRKYEQGRMRHSMDLGVAFEGSRLGGWEIFEPPQVGEVYVYGADVAGGAEVHADGRTESDFSTCHMVHCVTGKTVALFRDHMIPADFAWQLALGSAWYGAAQGFVERNNDGGTVIAFMEEFEIISPDGESVYGSDILLTQERLVKSDSGRARVAEVGWRTKKDTKKVMIQTLRDFLLKEAGLGAPDKPCPWEYRTLHEMLRYVKTESKEASTVRMEADEGHDDLVVSRALAMMARKQVFPELARASRVPIRLTPAELWAMRSDPNAPGNEAPPDRDLGVLF